MRKNVTNNKKKSSQKTSQNNQVITFVKIMIIVTFFVFEFFLYKNYLIKEDEIYQKQNSFNNELGEKFSSSIRKKDFFNDVKYINEYYAKYEENLKLTTMISQKNAHGGERSE